jgi:hypothetical protein
MYSVSWEYIQVSPSWVARQALMVRVNALSTRLRGTAVAQPPLCVCVWGGGGCLLHQLNLQVQLNRTKHTAPHRHGRN